jgi:hypothetical protein
MFSAVVQSLASDAATRKTQVRVDPRPLKADPSIVELAPSVARAAPDLVSVVQEPLADVPPEVVAARSRVLERLGIAAADMYTYAACPGMLETPPDQLQSRRPHASCPGEAFSSAVLGLPRPGGAYLPSSRIDERRQDGRRFWSVRVLTRHLEPVGASFVASDAVVERTPDGAWRVVKMVPVVVIE